MSRGIEASYCLFQTPWWLDVVAPGQWEEVIVEKGGEIVARMPYVVHERRGRSEIVPPPLTKFQGPWLAPSDAKLTKQYAREKDLLSALIDQMPEHARFQQNFHFELGNWLPFYWQGYEASPNYTYVLEDLRDPDRLWQGFDERIRRAIRKAEKEVTVRSDLGLEVLEQQVAQTYGRQGRRAPKTKAFSRIFRACEEEDCGRAFFAEDAQGRVHAAVYIVWDARSAFYIRGGGDPELRSSGATSLVMWRAIQFAATVTRRFDFEGSMRESIERFFRGFGAERKTYFRVIGLSPAMRRRQAFRELMGNLPGRRR